MSEEHKTLVEKYNEDTKELETLKADGDKIAEELTKVQDDFNKKNADLTEKGTKLQGMQEEMKSLNDTYVEKVKEAGIHEGETDIQNLKIGADEILKLKEESKDYQKKIQDI